MQLKSRLVFLHAHQKVYRLRNILVAYRQKELGLPCLTRAVFVSLHLSQCMIAKG